MVVAALALPWAASAQVLPSEPLTFGGGRVVVGGDAAVSVAPEDHGFFNYSDYEQTTLRQFRVGLSALVRVSERISVLGEVRSENVEYVTPFALYARIRPLANRQLDIQIGRIPPTFGSFSRRSYSHHNPLIGYPLAYQYLTSLRPDSVPRDADELLRMRGRGWLSQFTVGNPAPDRGVPLVSAFNWDTGVQVSTAWKTVTTTVAVTSGTLSNPRVADDNSGKQVAARVAVEPATGLAVAGSFARGEFLDRRVRLQLGDRAAGDYTQDAVAVDVEYSRDHWIARAETVVSTWHMPIGAAPERTALRAMATMVEGRYAVAPGWYAAARLDHLGFSRITGSLGTDEWDAPVTRVEVGGGHYLQRNLIVRASLQFNRRDTTRVSGTQLVAAQVLYWF